MTKQYAASEMKKDLQTGKVGELKKLQVYFFKWVYNSIICQKYAQF